MSISTSNAQTVKPAMVAALGTGWQILAFVEIFLLGVWLGSMAFFSFAVAPSAFAVLPSRHLSGQIVTSTISKVESLGLIIGPSLILIQIVSWRARHSRGLSGALRPALIAVMIVAAALSKFWVSPTMTSLRNQMGGLIDDVPATDPVRLQFNDLHQYSVALMAIALFAGVAALFFTVRSWLKH
ncbi:MAG: DUF4149 domain-containing protein [Blastocatellia bacterium]|nr:DUF4149 domain-containing protein [Blastocatellia bacterium]